MLYVSDINSFLFCKRKFALSKKISIKEEGYSLDLGNFFHEGLEYFYNNEKKYLEEFSLEKNNLEIVYRKLKNDSIIFVSRKIPELVNEINSLNKFLNIHMINRINLVREFNRVKKLQGKELAEAIMPKIKIEFPIKDEILDLSGRIDLIEIYDEEIVPVEIKSTETLRESYLMQAIAYGIMLKNNRFMVNKVKIINPSRSKEILLNPFHEIELKKLIYQMNEALEKIPPPERMSYCDRCVYYEYCWK
ncbi:MAG: CRISPR-associated protein Cas4 [Candidatus Woesearchaeota archaeon]